MSAATSLRHWLATADAAPARLARSSLRGVMRFRARSRSGSVYAEMDRIVAQANDNTVGSGLAASAERRRRSRSANRRPPQAPSPTEGLR